MTINASTIKAFFTSQSMLLWFGCIAIFIILVVLLIIIFKKKGNKKANVQAAGPDLMATDPNNNGNLNLMTPDPVATIPDAPVAPVVESIAEEPSLENQMTIETPVTPVTPVMEAAPTIVTPEPIVNKEVPVIDAFSMNAPVMPEAPTPVAPVEVPSTPEILAPELSNVDIPVAPNVEPLKIDQISTPESPTMEIPKIVSETEVPIMQTKKCPNCGYENANTVKACLKCGKLLD